MNKVDNSQRVAAKVAGFSLLFSMVIVVFANYVLLNPLIVRGNAVETARNIMAHETQFRVALTCFLAYSAIVVVLLAAFYVILKPVNEGLALVGALFRLVFAIMWLGALRLVGGASYLQAFESDRLQVLARLNIAATFDDYYVGLPFFGLAATVCAWLWLKSRYIPKGLAVFGIVSSAWCVICAFVFLFVPGFAKPVDPYWFDSPMAIFELILSVWLLSKGIRTPNPGEADHITESARKSVSLRLPVFL
jgi:Domain of unknown function (DUF4386)